MSAKKPAPTPESFNAQNQLSARLILSRPDQNPEGSLAEKWARKVLEQAKEEAK